MLDKLSSISSLARSRTLMAVLLKLFGYCCKLKSNRQLLLQPELRTTAVMLGSLQLCLAADGETASAASNAASGGGQSASGGGGGGGGGGGSGGTANQAGTLTETILELMEKLLVEAASSLRSVEDYQRFTSASVEQITALLRAAVHMKPGTDLHHRLMRVLPFLTYADKVN